MVRTKNLIKIWLISFGIFFLVSGCDVIDRTALFTFTGESGSGNLTKSTTDNRIESPDAAPTASQSQAQAIKRAIQVPRNCDATPSYNPSPIAIIRFNGKEGDFVRPLKAALSRITTLKEDVGFELQMVIPNSYLEDRENIDVVTPRQHIEKIRNSLISVGVPELDMIYTARESRSNSTYEIHIFALEICPYLIQGSGSLSVRRDYFVQIASLRSEDGARREWARMQRAHPDLLGDLELKVQSADLGERGVFFRIRTGPFANEATARDKCLQLKAVKLCCLVVRDP